MERWKINLYVLWFAQIISLMGIGISLPFLPYYIQELGINDPNKIKLYTGIINAVLPIGFVIMAPVWGYFADRVGRKKMFLRAVLSISFVLLGMGLSQNVGQLIFYRVLQGVLGGTVTAAIALVVTGTPENKIPSALGFFSSSTFIGISAGPILGGLLAEYIGFRNCFFISAILVMVDFFVVLFLVKEINFVKSKTENKKCKNNSDRISFIKYMSFTVVSMVIMMAMVRFSRTIFMPFLPLFIQDMRGTIEGAPMVSGIIQAGVSAATAVSGIVIGKLAEKYNQFKILIFIFLISAIIIIPVALVRNIYLFSIIFCLFFFILGGSEPLITTISTMKIPSERRGAYIGVQTSIVNIGWSLSPLVGSFISINFSINSILLIISPVLLIAFIISLKTYRYENKYTKKEGI